MTSGTGSEIGERAWLERLSAALARLAAPGAEQRRYITNLGTATSLDELALEFDDTYRPLKPVLESLADGAELLNVCQLIDVALQSKTLSWDFDSLGSAEWERIRRIAGETRDIVEAAIGRKAVAPGGRPAP